MPCAVNALLNDKGIPVVCETDIHGAITSLMVEAAGMGESRSFFADWTIRHPDNPMVSCFSTVDHGRSQSQREKQSLPIHLHLAIREVSQRKQRLLRRISRSLHI